jgi:hypothetical protein
MQCNKAALMTALAGNLAAHEPHNAALTSRRARAGSLQIASPALEFNVGLKRESCSAF